MTCCFPGGQGRLVTMSDEQQSQAPDSAQPQTETRPPVQAPPSAPHQVPQQAAPAPSIPTATEQKPRKLSRFLVVSIILLAALTISSISLLFIGDFEGRFERVFSTFTLFVIFVVLTAFDTRRGQSTDWYAPVALIANAYILGLGLIVIWVTPYHAYDLMWEIMWKSVLVILVTRATILACQLLLMTTGNQPVLVGRFAFITSVFAVLAGVLYTAPIGIDSFGLHVPDLYWRIAAALLILTGLALSITLLLRWYYAAEDRAERRRQIPPATPYIAAGQGHVAQQQAAQPVAPQQTQQPAQPDAQGLLPWPTFPDGRPLPAGPDGQPDFSATQR